jgi:hypothetical protein
MKSEDFLGLTKKGAQDKAEAKNFIFRLIRKDDQTFFSYPSDVRADRICVEIDKGAVTKATIQ